jgi:4a-hydroxytetrahydrobiopterin dehydratase
MSSKPLTEAEIQSELESLNGWQFEDDALTIGLEFQDFRAAISFVVRLSFEAEELGHHPEIINVYNTVDIRLTTHDAGDKVTARDIELARRIDNLEI